jgi:type IV pilus assembly protein PilA
VKIVEKFTKKLAMVRKGEKGFTLIELLVVIAILGVLAAVAIPNIINLMNSGETEAATTEQGTVALAVSVYAYENDGAIPADFATLVDWTSTAYPNGLFQQPPQYNWIINEDGSVEPASDNPIYEGTGSE